MFKFNLFSSTIFVFFILIIFLVLNVCIFTPILTDSNFDLNDYDFSTYPISSSGFLWPTPEYKTITSYFGKRNAPTSGASTSHSGIDIGAPTRYKYFSSI